LYNGSHAAASFLRSADRCGQGIGAPLQEGDRITVAQDFDRIALTQFTDPFFYLCEPGLPIFGPGANSVLYGRPVFFLIRRQFQRGLDDIDPHVRHRDGRPRLTCHLLMVRHLGTFLI
jgi:hypothetical protein